MDKDTSRKIVSETLQDSFDRNRFIVLIKNLFNKVDVPSSQNLVSNFPDIFKKSINSYERLTQFTDNNSQRVDVFIVYLNEGVSLDKARVTQRNFIAHFLKASGQKDAGLVAFVSADRNEWRFSLVKMEYRFEESKSGRIKVVEDFTPAKRWSFLVGKDEKSHTAQARLAPILEEEANLPTLKQIEDAFNIEKVTKEFFERYRDLYLRVKEELDKIVQQDIKVSADFENKDINTADFSKKLLGQIVFLYFLQKKGWFGVERDGQWGSGSKDFLRELFEKKHSHYDNFFNEILEPLFYDALARERDGDYCVPLNCKMPFLNGGLFDPIGNYDWVHTDIILPNDLFSNGFKTREGDQGTGILDIFDRYNFTVKEDEPLEREVAVDPEMLGKVFENLLEVKDRKSKGSYYTPREIVHYMCEQSLVNYLTNELEGRVDREEISTFIKFGDMVSDNDSHIEEVGISADFNKLKLPGVKSNAKFIDEKLASIKVCDPAIGSGAFPVGMMLEIVKARNVLTSYIKDEQRSIYEFKSECIQSSIYGVDIDPGAVEIAKLRLWLSLVVDEDDIKKVKPLPNLDYKIMPGDSSVFIDKNLFNKDQIASLEELKEKLIITTSHNKKEELRGEIEKMFQSLTLGEKIFDFELNFSEVFENNGGFDVVIANPPYVSINDLSRNNSLLTQYFKTKKISLSSYFGINLHSVPGNVKKYPPKPNLYAFFFVVAWRIMKENGTTAFIVPRGVLGAKDLDTLRHFFLDKCSLRELVLFNERLFLHKDTGISAVPTSSLIVILDKGNSITSEGVDILNTDLGGLFDADSVSVSGDFLRKNIDNWNILSIDETGMKIIDKYMQNDSAKIYYEHSNKNKPVSENFYFDVGFVLDSNLYLDEVAPLKEEDRFYSLLDSSCMKGLVLGTKGHYPKGEGNVQLTKNSQGYVVLDQRYKIVWGVKNPNVFSFTEEEIVFPMGKAAIIASNNKNEILYLLGLLNSSLTWFIFHNLLRIEGEKDFLLPISAIKMNLRVPTNPDPATKDRLIKLVASYIESKDDSALSNQLKEIDKLVFALYGLTDDEIRTISSK